MTFNDNASSQRTPIRGRLSINTSRLQQLQTNPLFASSSANPSMYSDLTDLMIFNDVAAEDYYDDNIPQSNYPPQQKMPDFKATIIHNGDAPAPTPHGLPSNVISSSSPFINNEARQLKSLIPTSNIPEFPKDKSGRRRQVEQDPDNYEIKRLRIEEHLSWSAIAETLNAERIKHGYQPTHTDASIYSRFVCNSPRIAQMQNRTSIPNDSMQMQNEGPARATAPKVSRVKWTSQDEIFLVQAIAEVREDFWGFVSEYLEEKGGKKFSAKECAERYGKI